VEDEIVVRDLLVEAAIVVGSGLAGHEVQIAIDVLSEPNLRLDVALLRPDL